MGEGAGDEPAYWAGGVWVGAGLRLTALRITPIGFSLSCTLCCVLAVRGYKAS